MMGFRSIYYFTLLCVFFLVSGCSALPKEGTVYNRKQPWASMQKYFDGFDEEFNEDWFGRVKSLGVCSKPVELQQRYTTQWAGLTLTRCHMSHLSVSRQLERLIKYSVFEKEMPKEHVEIFKEHYIRPLLKRMVFEQDSHDFGSQEELYVAFGFVWYFYPNFTEDKKVFKKALDYYLHSQQNSEKKIQLLCTELRTLEMAELERACFGEPVEKKNASTRIHIELGGQQDIRKKIDESIKGLDQIIELKKSLFFLRESTVSYYVSEEIYRSFQ